ncbi:ArsR/SmtB family transcription factor [Streptosporangium sp. NPDC002607]
MAVHAQPGRHRLHRFAGPVTQQATHIPLAPPPLISTGKTGEHLSGERLQPLLHGVQFLSGIELRDAARAFLKAMAGETRQQILALFAGGVELSVSEVAERLPPAQSATSTHLATLRDGGVLASRREWKTFTTGRMRGGSAAR